jgi:hypothetical protein
MIFTTDPNTKNALNPPLIAQAYGVMGGERKEMGLELESSFRKLKSTVLTADMHFIGTPMYSKPKRVKSKSNLSLIKTLPCMICGQSPVDPDHWKTRGAGGGDELENLSPLCRWHHIEKGLGVRSFYLKYETRIEVFRDKFGLPALKLRWDD